MPGYVPHLLLRNDGSFSPIAVSLRDAGYVVTKMTDDDALLQALTRQPIEAVLVELPAVATIRSLRLLQTHASHVPLLAATASPDVIRRAIATTNAELFDLRDLDADIVSATDLLLARSANVQMPYAS
ncbi:MAG: hypothetical protein M3Q69_06910 [Acidobacteriota bacterium]|nr:hypothetical protein [Acidobacteriota bacterium]